MRRNSRKRQRTKKILTENIEYNTQKIKIMFDKFNRNFNQYNNAIKLDPKSEFNHRIDLITYFINTYGNNYFLHKLKNVRDNIESYYINNIDDSNFNYDKYFDLKRDLNELIGTLEYYKYQIDIFIEPYDEFLNYNLNQKIIYKNQEIPNDLITNDLNYTGNDSIKTPIMYYNRIIRNYDEYFSDLEHLSVPLMPTNGDELFVKSFIDIDFRSIHEEVNNIINKIDENID